MKKDETHKEQMQIPTLKPNHFLQVQSERHKLVPFMQRK